MGKKVFQIAVFLAVAYFIFTLRGCIIDTGEYTVPQINPNPKQTIRITAKFERLPLNVAIDQYQHHVIARYESHKKSCAVIQAFSGAVFWSEINVPAKGSAKNGFFVMRDYAMQDKCDWKLTLIEYQVKDNQKVVISVTENAFELKSKKTKWFCKFNGYLDGSCAGIIANKKRTNFSIYGFDNTDDTTVEISMEIMK